MPVCAEVCGTTSRSSWGLSESSEGSVNRAVPTAQLCPPHAGPYGGCTGELGEPGRAVGEKFYSNRRVRCPLVPTGECDLHVWVIVWTGRDMKPIRSRTRLGVAGLADEGASWAVGMHVW